MAQRYSAVLQQPAAPAVQQGGDQPQPLQATPLDTLAMAAPVPQKGDQAQPAATRAFEAQEADLQRRQAYQAQLDARATQLKATQAMIDGWTLAGTQAASSTASSLVPAPTSAVTGYASQPPLKGLAALGYNDKALGTLGYNHNAMAALGYPDPQQPGYRPGSLLSSNNYGFSRY